MLNVGIIGASFARDAYLPAFAHIPGAKVAALAWKARRQPLRRMTLPMFMTIGRRCWPTIPSILSASRHRL